MYLVIMNILSKKRKCEIHMNFGESSEGQWEKRMHPYIKTRRLFCGSRTVNLHIQAFIRALA
jgi:hypothetical protein